MEIYVLPTFIVQGLLIYWSGLAFCDEKVPFFSMHRKSIENYIMTGYGEGWNHCDILHDTQQDFRSLEGTPKLVTHMNMLNGLNIISTLSSSNCLLVAFHVNNKSSLAYLIDFGWRIFRYRRLALVLKMTSNITLDSAVNTTKLPFLVAAELQQGKKQFLCPVTGENEPRLQSTECPEHYTSHEKKTIRAGLFGVHTGPYLYGNIFLKDIITQPF